eukprot:4590318-Prymnesium_polylepis.1
MRSGNGRWTRDTLHDQRHTQRTSAHAAHEAGRHHVMARPWCEVNRCHHMSHRRFRHQGARSATRPVFT